MRGVTRDRSYHEADWNGVHFTPIDTGGIEMGNEDAFQKSLFATGLSWRPKKRTLSCFWSMEKPDRLPMTWKSPAS
ncbi:MAG: hypothetical protein ACLTQI_01500 [Slackia sp.]